jgi:IMP dehydrogenase
MLSKPDFFAVMEQQGVALTYDDVRLLSGPSEVSPDEVDIRSNFSTHVPLEVPIVSAAMDTVTTSEMAITLAKLGGLGVIHAAMEPDIQRNEVRRVKLALNGLIEDPRYAHPEETIADVLALADQHEWSFRRFPVISEDRKLIGLLTNREIRFADSMDLRVSDVMKPLDQVVTAPAGTNLEEAYRIMRQAKNMTLPLVTPDGILAGMYLYSDVERVFSADKNHYNTDSNNQLYTAAAVPTNQGALERIDKMITYLDVAVVDTAQGDSKYAIQTLRDIKSSFPNLDVVIGNISNPESAVLLARAGADGIKVGQGPGSICTTRVETGIGTPQVTAVYECVKALQENGIFIPVCADGGIRNNGDVSIALAAGARSVMLGSMLAGTDETPGKVYRLENGMLVKEYRGMGSVAAMRESAAARDRYGANEQEIATLAEGIEAQVQYKGAVGQIIRSIEQRTRKSMSYCGAPTIASHQRNTRFLRITSAGYGESVPHDVMQKS